jgi:hypothetical protein
MKSLRRKLTSTSQFGKEINHAWIELWEKRSMHLKYRKVINQMIYDGGRSLTLPKKLQKLVDR